MHMDAYILWFFGIVAALAIIATALMFLIDVFEHD